MAYEHFTEHLGGAIEVVDVEGRLGVRKAFNGAQFVQVLEAMLDLADSEAIPAVIGADFVANTITTAFIFGSRVDETPTQGSDTDVSRRIEESLLKIHRAGYALGEIDKESLLIDASDGKALFLDLRHALPLAGLPQDMSVYLRDIDSARCNDLFGTSLITAATLRSEALGAETGDDGGDRAYASIVIRDDIHWGNFWNTDVGSGRWNYILKDHLPIPQSGTVLDLGSNNGFNPLQMLRHGAASAVGVEFRDSIIRDGEFLKSAFEWLDNQTYDFRYVHGSFADLPTFGLGRFDMVSALCALYYLDDREMREIARYIRTLTDVLVLQCNVDRLIYRANEEEFRRASVEFAIEVLDQAGFHNRQIVAPAGYSRPLVIGRAT